MEKGKANILEKARKDAERTIVPVIAKKSKQNQPKVARYRPGQAPGWAKGEESDEEEGVQEVVREISVKRDRRLERLQDVPIDREEALRRRRERQAEVVEEESEPFQPEVKEESEESSNSFDEEQEAEAQRRKQLRLQKIKLSEIAEKQEAEPQVAVVPEEESSEYESYYSSDEADTGWGVTIIQPVFVGKQERDTIAEKEAIDREAEALEEARLKREQERQAESKAILREELKREFDVEAKQAKAAGEIEEEVEDEAAEYEQWKQRELARIRRDKVEKEVSFTLTQQEFIKEQAEVERRRAMTDAEIEREDAEGKLAPKKKGEMRFMQKYYHKGAYFRDGGQYDVTNMPNYVDNYLQPTGEDHFDKTALPKVLQVKNFGKAGRTKYTHLVDQDTTFNEAYSQKFYQHLAPLPPVEWQVKKGMGGVGDVVGNKKKK